MLYRLIPRIDTLSAAIAVLVVALSVAVTPVAIAQQGPKQVAWDQVGRSRSQKPRPQPEATPRRETNPAPVTTVPSPAPAPRQAAASIPTSRAAAPRAAAPRSAAHVTELLPADTARLPSRRPDLRRPDLRRPGANRPPTSLPPVVAAPQLAVPMPHAAAPATPPATLEEAAPGSVSLANAQQEILPQPIALSNPQPPENVHVAVRQGRVTIQAIDASLSGVLAMIAEENGLNIVSGDIGDERVTLKLRDVELDDAFHAILAVNGYTWTRQRNIVIVSSLKQEDQDSGAIPLGREVRVYNLNYVLAADIESVVSGLLSPVGKVFAKQTSSTDQRQTHEQLVVEDLPEHLLRIESYLSQTDIPPRQVSVEAHVLQVNLRDELRHGIDFKNLLRICGSEVSLESPGFASDAGPTTVLRFKGHDMSGLLEAIKTTTDAKTLASPNVTVLNGQEARMQVGGQIGYLMTTTTQTSTLQSVNFLDVGVILSVTPIITQDQQVLLQVRPQVSTGNINATTQLPESETTEVDTTVMLADGEGLIIGGLIQEVDNESQNKLPVLGNVKYLGRLFQKRTKELERNEIIIALVPRIVHDEPYLREMRSSKLEQATTRLLHGPLHENDRRHWEPELPDAKRNDSRKGRHKR